MPVLHLSPSTCQSYRKCGRQVLYEKVMGLTNPTKYAATVYGSAMHKSVDDFWKDKMAGKTVSVDTLISRFTDNFAGTAPIINVWGEDDPDHLREQGILACKDFFELFKDLQPVSTEKHYNIKRASGMDIMCVADLETEDGVYDYKFGRGLWGSAVTGEYMLNMATYAMAYMEEYRKLPKVIMVKQQWTGKKMPSGKKKWSHKGFIVDQMPMDDRTIAYYLNVYNEVEKGITAGVFLPASDNNGLCKKCGFRGNPCDVVLLSDNEEE